MDKLFNIAGPCIPDRHYMLPALERNPEIKSLIDKNQYFVIHAARQTGKTTLLKSLVKQLNGEGIYNALYCSLEAVQGIKDPKEGIPAIVRSLNAALEFRKTFQHVDILSGDLEPSEGFVAIGLP